MGTLFCLLHCFPASVACSWHQGKKYGSREEYGEILAPDDDVIAMLDSTERRKREKDGSIRVKRRINWLATLKPRWREGNDEGDGCSDADACVPARTKRRMPTGRRVAGLVEATQDTGNVGAVQIQYLLQS